MARRTGTTMWAWGAAAALIPLSLQAPAFDFTTADSYLYTYGVPDRASEA